MLSLGVSPFQCFPGRLNRPGNQAQPIQVVACQSCGLPAGTGGRLLDEHKVSKTKSVHLCQICHTCLHLDWAGRNNAGVVIWLPELRQYELNIIWVASYALNQQASELKDDKSIAAMNEQANRMLLCFKSRSDDLQRFLSGGKEGALVPKDVLSSPGHIAALILESQEKLKLSPKVIAERINGLRLYPNPNFFKVYLEEMAKILRKDFPADKWLESVSDAMANSKTLNDDGGQFDAGETRQVEELNA